MLSCWGVGLSFPSSFMKKTNCNREEQDVVAVSGFSSDFAASATSLTLTDPHAHHHIHWHTPFSAP